MWTAWSAYWSYQEDFFLDLDAVNKLSPRIEDPVLIVGAGQGLLVEQLMKNGFKVDGIELDSEMIKYAKERRGLELIYADARKMPFADGRYKTSIIATGVIDFLNDEEQIKLIMDETRRVTGSGQVFVAFYKYHPRVEELLRTTYLITNDGLHQMKKMYEMLRLSVDKPIDCISVIRKEANVGFFSALLILIKSEMFLPKKEKVSNKNWSRAWKKAKKELDNPDILIDSVPECIPYRNEQDIRKLFERLGLAVNDMLFYDNCIIAQL